jgi:hypothetical protein
MRDICGYHMVQSYNLQYREEFWKESKASQRQVIIGLRR